MDFIPLPLLENRGRKKFINVSIDSPNLCYKETPQLGEVFKRKKLGSGSSVSRDDIDRCDSNKSSDSTVTLVTLLTVVKK